MLSIRLEHFRNFIDTGRIDLKPLTILVGKNSSGKSSVARFLPLLRQSVEARSSVPILWYGEFVDFGSITEVSTKLSEGNVSFEIEVPAQGYFRRRMFRRSRVRRSDNTWVNKISFRLILQDENSKTGIVGFEIKLDDDRVRILIGKGGSVESAYVNKSDYSYLFQKNVKVDIQQLVPTLILLESNERNNWMGPTFSFPPAEFALHKEMRNNLHGGFSESTLKDLCDRIQFAHPDEFFRRIKTIGSEYKSWRDLIELFSNNERAETFERIRHLALISELPDILFQLDRMFSLTFRSVGYIGPSRDQGQRYHRIRELAVQELDPAGTNLAMFLQSLSKQQQSEFSDWAEQYLGYAVHARSIPGHVSVMLREAGSIHEYNITDVGYGLSQVLPVAVQLWAYSSNVRRRGVALSFLTIEQPELHLHPSHQANLADLFAGALHNQGNQSSNNLSLIIETHSQHLITRIGDLIRNGKISHDDVVIYLFDKDEVDGPTLIRTSDFDEEGDLQNWPFGFFSAES